MSDAWRYGVPYGLVLFALALLSNVPYFVPAFSDQGLQFAADGFVLLALAVYIEIGRRTAKDSGKLRFAALAGGIAGFLASLESILQHALLSIAPGYDRFVSDLYGHARFLASMQLSSGAAAMAGIMGAVVASVLMGVVIALLGGAIGILGRRMEHAQG